MPNTVRIKGLRELQRDFKRMSKDLDTQVTDELKKAAEPVRELAEQRILGSLTNMTQAWSIQRVGVSRAKGSVYIAPKPRRGPGGSPRSIGGVLLFEMEAAADAKQEGVVNALEHMIDRLGNHYGL